MKHNYLSNAELLDAKNEYIRHLSQNGFIYKTENIKVQNASGRVLAKAVYAEICSPHYNASAMDGIAVKAEITYGASESNPVIITPGMYTVVDTGDPIPDGADSVIMVEDLTNVGEGRL